MGLLFEGIFSRESKSQFNWLWVKQRVPKNYWTRNNRLNRPKSAVATCFLFDPQPVGVPVLGMMNFQLTMTLLERIERTQQV